MTEYVIFLIVSGLTFKSLISKHLSDSSWIDKIAFGGWFHSFNAASIVSFPWFQVFPIGPLPFTSPHPSPFNYATIPLVFVRVISIPMKAFCSYEAFYRIEWMMIDTFITVFLKRQNQRFSLLQNIRFVPFSESIVDRFRFSNLQVYEFSFGLIPPSNHQVFWSDAPDAKIFIPFYNGGNWRFMCFIV